MFYCYIQALDGFSAANKAEVVLKRYNIIVATGSWVLTVSSVVPLVLVTALIRQLRPTVPVDTDWTMNEAN